MNCLPAPSVLPPRTMFCAYATLSVAGYLQWCRRRAPHALSYGLKQRVTAVPVPLVRMGGKNYAQQC